MKNTKNAVRIASQLMLGIAVLGGSPSFAEEYQLAAQDRLRIKVVEWRPGGQESFEWTALTGEYVVNSAGSLSLPLLGAMNARGKTVDQLSSAISQKLKSRAGLQTAPEASVEVIQYRPIYIVGDVERPGEYTYRPELTVVKAMAIAGGLYRPGEAGARPERDQISAVGSYESARLELQRMVVRRARLQAELDYRKTFDPPRDLAIGPAEQRIVDDEAALMRSRYGAFESQIAAAGEIRELFSKEVASLNKKQDTQKRQVDLAQEEQARLEKLSVRGLTTKPRLFNTQRISTEIQSESLDVDSALLRAMQEYNKAQRSEVDLKTTRQTDLMAELQSVQANIDQLTAKLEMARGLIQEASSIAPRLNFSALAANVPRATITYAVTRRTGDGEKDEEIAVEGNAAVLPGDVIRVQTTMTTEPIAANYLLQGTSRPARGDIKIRFDEGVR